MMTYLAVGLGVVAVAALIFAVVAATRGGVARPNGQSQIPQASAGERISEIRAATGRTSSGAARGVYWTPLPGGGFATESWDDRAGATAPTQAGQSQGSAPVSSQPINISVIGWQGGVAGGGSGQPTQLPAPGQEAERPERPRYRIREAGEEERPRQEPRREGASGRDRAPREEPRREERRDRPAERPAEPRGPARPNRNPEPDVRVDEASGRITIVFPYPGVDFRVYAQDGWEESDQLLAGDRELVYEPGDIPPGPKRVEWFDERGICSRFRPFNVPAPPRGE